MSWYCVTQISTKRKCFLSNPMKNPWQKQRKTMATIHRSHDNIDTPKCNARVATLRKKICNIFHQKIQKTATIRHQLSKPNNMLPTHAKRNENCTQASIRSGVRLGSGELLPQERKKNFLRMQNKPIWKNAKKISKKWNRKTRFFF